MREDVLEIVNREQLVSCMNNTKWKLVLENLNSVHADKRVKYIDSNQLSDWQLGAWIPAQGYVEFSCGPVLFSFIEWLEIKKKSSHYVGRLVADELTDRSREIRDALVSVNLDIEETPTSYIIYGYRRASH